MADLTTVYLVRHAESSPDPSQPESRWPLSSAGVAQAEALVPVLADLGVQRVFSSPSRRAMDTVAPFAARTELKIKPEADLRERRLTTGYADNWEALAKQAWDDLDFALPGCESGSACQVRIAACIERLARTNRRKQIAVSSHGNAIALFLNTLDPKFGYDQWRAMRNPELFEVVFGPMAITLCWRSVPL